ncbi:MAG: hypothetical protein U0T82_09050 [Bacteroidales bacterium]
MRSYVRSLLYFCLLGLLMASCTYTQDNEIYISAGTSVNQQLAAKELRRYIYLVSGRLLPIKDIKTISQVDKGGYLICFPGDTVLGSLVPESINKSDMQLTPQSLLIRSFDKNGKTFLLLTGGSDQAVFYAVYRYIESLGVRFYPHGDVIPDLQYSVIIDSVSMMETPAFSMRGIQPFHDFPEGPDWWSLDEYKSVVTQLARMRMNFIGFHTYPESEFGGWSRAEPMVWIGLKENINEDGTVKTAYPVMHSHTGDSSWGYFRKKTSDFSYGASQLFEEDDYGAGYMRGAGSWPHSPEANIAVFNEFGSWQKEVFTLAQRLGVKTCIGTETPLVIPALVKDQLRTMGIDPASAEATRLVYEGIFTRIRKLHPLDYYWMWTPENWTWSGADAKQVKATEKDMMLAMEAAYRTKAPFNLATCGWVLGPPNDRAAFDRILPKDIPFSCINREVGFSPVEPGFADIKGREKWQISWLEDDPGLISPQLWAGRVLRDAWDAMRYGCTGMMGIHWRTQNLAPAFGALEYAGWHAHQLDTTLQPTDRDLNTSAFYLDFARANFGVEVADKIAAIFSTIDGGPLFIPGKNQRVSNLPRTSDWAMTGPGGVKPDYRSWESVSPQFAFVDDFEDLSERITGAGARERYSYWLNTFRYARSLAQMGCLLGSIDRQVTLLGKEAALEDQRQLIRENILPLRDSIYTIWGHTMDLLLSIAGTSGEMGTIANLEMHNLGQMKLLTKYDQAIDSLMGEVQTLPAMEKAYRGDPRIIVPVRRSLLSAGEPFRLKIMLLGVDENSVPVLYWRKLGKDQYKERALVKTSRGVWQLVLSPEEYGNKDFEYHIEVDITGDALVYPVTSPDQDATVVIDNGL